MDLHGLNFVADQLSRGSGEAFHATSPLNCSALKPAFYRAQAKDVAAAMESAEAAFVGFRVTSGAERAAFLERIGDEILPWVTSLFNAPTSRRACRKAV